MKYIRTFESHRAVKGSLKTIDAKVFNQVVDDLIKESVIQVGDIYKVRVMADVPQSLLNAYVKKVKDTTGKNVRQFFGDVEVAEELVRHIVTLGLDVDTIDPNVLLGGPQAQSQSSDQAQVVDAQVQPVQGTTQEVPQTTQEVPQTTQEVPQTTQEVPQTTQEVPQTTQEVPQSQFEEPVQTQVQEEEEEEDEELPL
jgi:hypothetical protein